MAGRVSGPLIAGSIFLDIDVRLPFMVTLGLVAIVVMNAARLVWVARKANRQADDVVRSAHSG
jgi:hypothetical protein